LVELSRAAERAQAIVYWKWTANGKWRIVGARWEEQMGSISIWHWVVVIVMFASPIMGIVRGVKNGSAIHAVLSAFVPVYGLIYFFVAANPDPIPGTPKLPG
jgi:hypothetical protein